MAGESSPTRKKVKPGILAGKSNLSELCQDLEITYSDLDVYATKVSGQPLEFNFTINPESPSSKGRDTSRMRRTNGNHSVGARQENRKAPPVADDPQHVPTDSQVHPSTVANGKKPQVTGGKEAPLTESCACPPAKKKTYEPHTSTEPSERSSQSQGVISEYHILTEPSKRSSMVDIVKEKCANWDVTEYIQKNKVHLGLEEMSHWIADLVQKNVERTESGLGKAVAAGVLGSLRPSAPEEFVESVAVTKSFIVPVTEESDSVIVERVEATAIGEMERKVHSRVGEEGFLRFFRPFEYEYRVKLHVSVVDLQCDLWKLMRGKDPKGSLTPAQLKDMFKWDGGN